MVDDRSSILLKLASNDFIDKMKELNIQEVLVFGSILTDNFNEESDVDIAILSAEKMPIKNVLNLEMFLEDLLNRAIDVVDLNNDKLDIFVKIDILNTGKSIFSADNGESLNSLINSVDIYYKENEYYFSCRKRDVLSWMNKD